MKTITWIWIFLLIVAVILFIIAITIYETKYTPNPMPSWNWFIIGIAFLIFIISLLLYLYSVSCRYYPENCKNDDSFSCPTQCEKPCPSQPTCEMPKSPHMVQAQVIQTQPLIQPIISTPLTRNDGYKPVNINNTCTSCSVQP